MSMQVGQLIVDCDGQDFIVTVEELNEQLKDLQQEHEETLPANVIRAVRELL